MWRLKASDSLPTGSLVVESGSTVMEVSREYRKRRETSFCRCKCFCSLLLVNVGETRKARGNYLMMSSLMGLYNSLMMGVAIGQSFDALASVRQLQPIREFGLTSVSIVLRAPMRLNPICSQSDFSVDCDPSRTDFGGGIKVRS